MGIAGVALLFGIISFFRLIGAIFSAIGWKSKKTCPAVITGIEKQFKRNKNVEVVTYALDVNCEGLHMAGRMKEDVDTSKEALSEAGTQLTVKFNEKNGKCVKPVTIRKNITSNLIMLVVCIAVFIGCYYLAQAIS